jgi:hypothetical protein
VTSVLIEPIDGFRSPGEYERFLAWLGRQVDAGVLEEVPVGAPYLGITTLTERWYRVRESGDTWRLLEPDPPFMGSFERV